MGNRWQLAVLGLGLMGTGMAGCASSKSCADDDVACIMNERRCTVEAKDAQTAVVTCNDGFAVDVWADGRTDEGCYLLEPSADEEARAIQCGARKVVLNTPCPDGFDGNVVLGVFPRLSEWWAEEDRYSGVAFLLSQCASIQGDFALVEFDGSNYSASAGEPKRGNAAGIDRMAHDGWRAQKGESDASSLPLPLRELRRVDGSVLVSSLFTQGPFTLPKITTIGERYTLIHLGGDASVETPKLEEIGLSLVITENRSLENIALPALRKVGESIEVDRNVQLGSIALDALEEVGGSLFIYDNPSLTQISVPQLRTVTDVFSLDELGALKSFSSPLLRTVGGELEISEVLVSRLDAFPALESVGRLNMSEIRALTVVDFPALEEIIDEVGFHDLPNLNDVYFPKLAAIGGELRFGSELGIESMELPVLHTTGGITIESAFRMRSIRLPKLRVIKGDYRIERTQDLLNVVLGNPSDGVRVEGNLAVADAQGLIGFSGENLKEIQGNIGLTGPNLSGDYVVAAHGAVGEIRVELSAVTSVTLPNVTTAHRLFVIDNTALTSFIAPALNRVEGFVTVHQNDVLEELDLRSLRVVTNIFRVTKNPLLDSILAEHYCRSLVLPRSCDISENL